MLYLNILSFRMWYIEDTKGDVIGWLVEYKHKDNYRVGNYINFSNYPKEHRNALRAIDSTKNIVKRDSRAKQANLQARLHNRGVPLNEKQFYFFVELSQLLKDRQTLLLYCLYFIFHNGFDSLANSLSAKGFAAISKQVSDISFSALEHYLDNYREFNNLLYQASKVLSTWDIQHRYNPSIVAPEGFNILHFNLSGFITDALVNLKLPNKHYIEEPLYNYLREWVV